MATVVTYETLMQNTQNVIWTLLKNDTTMKSLSNAILSGVPVTRGRQVGFPYVKVSAPLPSENQETFTAYNVSLPLEIEIFASKIENTWKLADRIRYLLKTNAATFKKTNGLLILNKNISTSETFTLIDEMENKPVYHVIVRTDLRWFGQAV